MFDSVWGTNHALTILVMKLDKWPRDVFHFIEQDAGVGALGIPERHRLWICGSRGCCKAPKVNQKQ